MNINEIKKDLYKTKAPAIFHHYAAPNLYYSVKLLDDTYLFPIMVIDKKMIKKYESVEQYKLGEDPIEEQDSGIIELSSDLGTTPFHATMEGKFLIRWIVKAFEIGELVKLSQ